MKCWLQHHFGIYSELLGLQSLMLVSFQRCEKKMACYNRTITSLARVLAYQSATVATLLTIGLMPLTAVAAPADVFKPHLDRIRKLLPSKLVMRLPSRILLGGPADEEFIQNLSIYVFDSISPPSMTVGLFSCSNAAPICLIGTFSVTSMASSIAQQEFKQHIAGAAPIKLTPTISGYLLETPVNVPPSLMSSVMWQQDGMFYTAKFASPERQNMLYMAVSMANNPPIFALNAALPKQSNFQFKTAL